MNHGIKAAAASFVSRAGHSLEHHPKKVTAGLAVLLLCGWGGAFAVASLDPAPEHVTVRQIVEAVQPLAVEPQLQALEAATLNLYRSETTRPSDTVESLLARLGIDDAAAVAFLRNDSQLRAQLLGFAGRRVTAEATHEQRLARLVLRWASDDTMFRRVVVQRDPAGSFAVKSELVPLVATTRLGSATVRSSLFGAADEAGIPDPIVSQLAEIFSSEVDFQRSLRVGDRFSVVYEALEADGEPLRTGRLLSVELVNQGRRHEAMWFQEPGRKGAYYTADGRSLESSYLASPMAFSRVTSGFAMRMHPILHQWKAHLGTDFAGAIGTPVRVVGDGVVEFAGVQNGFGNVVIVRHNASEETLYAHLSRIGVHAGQRVEQGQNVGAVGMTGWATGPHLHFEFRVNGVHQDPVQMAHRALAQPLSAVAMPAFQRYAKAMHEQLHAASASTARIE